jgi:hypothetical protein
MDEPRDTGELSANGRFSSIRCLYIKELPGRAVLCGLGQAACCGDGRLGLAVCCGGGRLDRCCCRCGELGESCLTPDGRLPPETQSLLRSPVEAAVSERRLSAAGKACGSNDSRAMAMSPETDTSGGALRNVVVVNWVETCETITPRVCEPML